VRIAIQESVGSNLPSVLSVELLSLSEVESHPCGVVCVNKRYFRMARALDIMKDLFGRRFTDGSMRGRPISALSLGSDG